MTGLIFGIAIGLIIVLIKKRIESNGEKYFEASRYKMNEAAINNVDSYLKHNNYNSFGNLSISDQEKIGVMFNVSAQFVRWSSFKHTIHPFTSSMLLGIIKYISEDKDKLVAGCDNPIEVKFIIDNFIVKKNNLK